MGILARPCKDWNCHKSLSFSWKLNLCISISYLGRLINLLAYDSLSESQCNENFDLLLNTTDIERSMMLFPLCTKKESLIIHPVSKPITKTVEFILWLVEIVAEGPHYRHTGLLLYACTHCALVRRSRLTAAIKQVPFPWIDVFWALGQVPAQPWQLRSFK